MVLPDEAILNCLIYDLEPQIRNKMDIHRPISISQAIGLAKLVEAKFKDAKPKFQKPFSTPFKRTNHNFQSTPISKLKNLTFTKHTPNPKPHPNPYHPNFP